MVTVAVEVIDMAEVVLTKRDVEAKLSQLEQKYGFPSYAFQHDCELRQRVSEEDEFEWAAYLEHKWAIEEADQELHREYLNRLLSGTRDNATRKAAPQALLAA